MARGATLPPPDSIQDRILVELLQRERLAKVKEWELSLSTIGSFLGVPGEDLKGIIGVSRDKLMEELFHLGYDLKRLQAKILARRDKLQEQREQMEKLNRMG